VRGLLPPDFLGLAGFEKVETTNCYSTLLGTLSLYQANKTVAQRSSQPRFFLLTRLRQ